MAYGIPNYGQGAPPPGMESYIEDPMEDKESLAPPPQLGSISSPGQPTGKGGFNWKKGATMAIAAPLVAALVNKLSGGKVSMGDALAGLGGGFMDQKLTMMKEKRHQGIQEENRMLDLAHDSVKGLSNIPPETLAKFPKLQSLSQKYQEALASDGKISPKEAGEIITQYQMAAADMAAAQKEVKQTGMLQDQGALQQQQLTNARQGRVDDLASTFPQPEGLGEDEASYIQGGYEDQARGMLNEDEIQARKQRELVPFRLGNQDVMGTRSEALRDINAEEGRRHALRMEELRADAIAKMGGGRQDAGKAAEYTADLAEWTQLKNLVMQGFESDEDPLVKQTALADFIKQHPMPRKSDYVGGGKGKLDRGVLDGIVDRYVTPSTAPTQTPGANPARKKWGNVQVVSP